MKRHTRTRLLVDPKVQGALLFRVVLYWCVSVAVVVMLAAVQVAWTVESAGWPVVFNRAALAFGPALIAAVALLPALLFDTLRVSSSFTGPMKRLRAEVRRLADGEQLEPIKFRGGDFWDDLAGEFNRLSEEITRLRKQQAAPAGADGAVALAPAATVDPDGE